MSDISCCGTECSTCYCYGNMCNGCNECEGKVFHAPKGEACAIYECAINQKHLKNCGECEEVPCSIWMKTRDPKFSDEEFEKNTAMRIQTLKKNSRGVSVLDNKELKDYIMEQLFDLKDVRNIPMMGGYIFYYKEKIIGGIYGKGFMVKITDASRKYMPDCEAELPYEGAKPMFLVTILEDRELLQKMVKEMYDELPERAPKKKRR